jgi:hypothetical protein
MVTETIVHFSHSVFESVSNRAQEKNPALIIANKENRNQCLPNCFISNLAAKANRQSDYSNRCLPRCQPRSIRLELGRHESWGFRPMALVWLIGFVPMSANEFPPL